MRLHVVSLPWTETTKDYLTCAYTQKVVKFCQMMDSLGYEVVLYAGEENDAPCTEHHVVVTKEEREKWFGKSKLDVSMAPKITWDPRSEPWMTMNGRVIGLLARADSKDIFCPVSGGCQYLISQSRPELSVAEWAIGYEGVVMDKQWHRCFESYAWMHYVYAQQKVVNGIWYDVVIPNSFDPEDFTFQEKPADDGYLLYMGRVIQRKGVEHAAEIAKRLDRELLVAGPGAKQKGKRVVAQDVEFEGTYVGPADIQKRKELLGGASVLLAPTLYIEPFGGIAVEAMLCGTPVVATPWGAFAETVREGISGALFHTIPEGAEAVLRAMELDRGEVRKWAEQYSIWNVRHQYDRWLNQIHGLQCDGTGVGDFYGTGAA